MEILDTLETYAWIEIETNFWGYLIKVAVLERTQLEKNGCLELACKDKKR
jgi:hypothetical protein